MTDILIDILIFGAGAAAAWLLLSGRQRSERALHAKELEHSAEEVSRLKAEAERERAASEARLKEQKAEYEARQREGEERWEKRLGALKDEILAHGAQQLSASRESLTAHNSESLEGLLKPLREQFELFRKALNDSATTTATSNQSLGDRFESTLKLFEQQQQNAVTQLRNQTERISNEAVALTQALKGDSKRQGNWGEMVLQTMLEDSGLEEGVNYFRQLNVTDESGRRNIPDVVVKLPDQRALIIDAKVSLTAYAQYYETDDEASRAALLKAHVNSVLKHIDELSVKNYPRVVENSLDFVLMFIPNESSYAAAVKARPDIVSVAYSKKVMVITPTTLMLALQVAHNLWQSDRQAKNVERIVDRGEKLYEKVVAFQDSFLEVKSQIDKLQATYARAHSQLSEGPGNVLRQCERLRELGVNPKKRLRGGEE